MKKLTLEQAREEARNIERRRVAFENDELIIYEFDEKDLFDAFFDLPNQ